MRYLIKPCINKYEAMTAFYKIFLILQIICKIYFFFLFFTLLHFFFFLIYNIWIFFSHVLYDFKLSSPALKQFNVFASRTFCGISFQRGITLFRKNSFLDAHIFAGSLRKHIHPLLKFLAAGPSLSPWTIFFGLF